MIILVTINRRKVGRLLCDTVVNSTGFLVEIQKQFIFAKSKSETSDVTSSKTSSDVSIIRVPVGQGFCHQILNRIELVKHDS